MNNTPESLYAQAALISADFKLAGSLNGMKQLCAGWTEAISPAPVHWLLSHKLPVLEGRNYNQAIFLQLAKVGASEEKLTVNHARLWQFLSLRFFPGNPNGLLQFQMELSVILEELAKPSQDIPGGTYAIAEAHGTLLRTFLDS